MSQLVIARSESDEAIHVPASGDMDCFAEPVIGPRIRADPLARNDDGVGACAYRIVIASPLKSAFAIRPVCVPDNSSTAPFWLVSTMARAPRPTARPAPAAP